MIYNGILKVLSKIFRYLDTSKIHCMFHLVPDTFFKHLFNINRRSRRQWKTTLICILKGYLLFSGSWKIVLDKRSIQNQSNKTETWYLIDKVFIESKWNRPRQHFWSILAYYFIIQKNLDNNPCKSLGRTIQINACQSG